MTHAPDVAAVCKRLRASGVDVVRVSYPDMIGVDRGRDVLLDELPAAAEHGLAFCRAVYHTSPMGDVVPVPGGLDQGLPDISVRPDLSTLTALPWEPDVAWCLGDATAADGQPAPESPRVIARQVADRVRSLGYRLICGPELEFFLLRAGAGPAGWRRYADDPGNVYVVGRKGDPQGLLLHMLRQLRDAGLRVTAANHEFSPGQFEINLGHSDLPDAADRSFRLKSAVQEIARHRGLLATFMAKPFNDEGGSGFHVHVSVADDDGDNVFGDPDGPDGLSAAGRHAIARRAGARAGAGGPAQPHGQLVQAVRPGHAGALADRLGAGQPQRDGAHPAGARPGGPDGDPARRRHRQPVPGHRRPLGAAVYLGIRDEAEPPGQLEGYGYDPGRSPLLPMRLQRGAGRAGGRS